MKFHFFLFLFLFARSAFASPPIITQSLMTQKDFSISLKTTSLKKENSFQAEQSSTIGSELSLQKAVHIAIASFINDYDEGNQSPLDVIFDSTLEKSYLSLSVEQDNPIKLAKNELENIILEKGTSLILVNEQKVGEELGFNPENNWVFELKVPAIPGFTFWCVVSKFGEEPPFTFGEN